MSFQPSPEEAPLLEIRGLNAAFREGKKVNRVVKDLDLTVWPSQTLAIVGESGSGKSITAMSILGLVPKTNGTVTGSIKLGSRELLGLSDDALSDIRGNAVSMIFQEPMTSLNPVMTIGDQIMEVLKRHRGMDTRSAETEALRLLDQVRIPNASSRLKSFPHLFSGGMRQRAMIAMALACRPKLLIADEPTTALDVTIQSQILRLIEELQSEIGMSVLFITHDMGVVAEIADQVAVMKDGEKVEEADVRTLFTAPLHPYTQRLLAAVPRLGSMAGKVSPQKFPSLDGDDAAEPAPSASLIAAGRGPLLEIENLCTNFVVRSGVLSRISGEIRAVDNVSLSLARGETLAIVGESGSGKSTTGRSLLRLVEPSSGSARFNGHDIVTADASTLRVLRRDMQMIFQDPYSSLNPKQMVGAAIAEPIMVHGLANRTTAMDRAITLLERVGLRAEHAVRYPHEFSGGQRQRICIARALGTNPKLIIADEAVSALDVSIRAQVINLMMDLQAELNLSYIFISHDIAVVERIAHKVAVMHRGRIVEQGPRRAVFENPQHPYTQRLMNAVPVPDPNVKPRSVRSDGSVHGAIFGLGAPRAQILYREISTGHLVEADANTGGPQ